MSRASAAANGVAKAVEEYASLYRVPWFRMQSRAFNVIGANGKERPMFMGQWTDAQGVIHRKGMADYLLTPRIELVSKAEIAQDILESHLPGPLREIATATISTAIFTTVPLWVECKAGSGKLRTDQQDFRDYILSTGAYYLLIENNPELVLEWLRDHRVMKA